MMQDFNDVVQKLPNLHLTSATKTIFEKLQSCLAIITYSIIKYSKSEDRQLMQKPAWNSYVFLLLRFFFPGLVSFWKLASKAW